MSSEKKVIRSLGCLSSQSYGARFYKVDLHFHTPASEDARGKNRYKFNPYKPKYPKKKGDLREYYKKVKDIQEELLIKSRKIADEMVKRFREERLSLVAISDHNSIGTIWSDPEAKNMMDLKAPTWYELIDDAAEKINRAVGKRVLTILPGVEISCTGIHILGVFPPPLPRRSIQFTICQLLNEIGFAIEEWGKNPKVGKRSVIDAVDLIYQKGGIPIPAHIDGSDQALLKLYKLNGGAMKNVFCNDKLSAVEIVKPSKFKRKDKKLKKTLKEWIDLLRVEKGLNLLAYFQGSDAHDLKTIGKRYTLLKMTEPSFTGLKNSVNIPSSRVRISANHNPVVSGLYIYGLEINSRLFGKAYLRFNRHLNCIMGKKETGKTTLFRLMQSAVDKGIERPQDGIKLFVDKIIDSKSHPYCFSRNKKSNTIDLYAIDNEDSTAKKISMKQVKNLAIMVKFYHPEAIDSIISSENGLKMFLVRHFRIDKKGNIKNFNKMFSTSNFLAVKKEVLLRIKREKNSLKLYLNVDWNEKKSKMVEFSKLNNSLKRTAMIMMIIMDNQFGPVIIDAPEDYVDNEDIANFLIPVIRKYKDFRQIIFFTSNPILAVNSDPENYVLLVSRQKKSKDVISGFSIDLPDEKNRVITLMEGGVSSFNKRKNRYLL